MSNIEQVFKIFKQIQETNSINDKLDIIKTNKDNGLFKDCLKFLFDTNIVTGISEKKINKQVGLDCDVYVHCFKHFLDVVKYLKHNNTGKDEDIMAMQLFISQQPQEYQELYKQLITKNLKLGCDTKIINKAIPDLIPTWEVQLGSAYDKLKLKKNEYFYLSRKLNGNRCSYIDGKLISRQGKEFTGMQHIIDEIELLGLSDYFIDGELERKNIDNLSDSENFRIGTGIINSDIENKWSIKMTIFDLFPAIELKNKQSKDTYKTRREHLINLKEKIEQSPISNIEIVQMVYEGTDIDMIDEYLNRAVDYDWEGLMLNKDVVYKCKRTTDLIKIKRFYTMDLEIVDAVEGEGRLKNTLGAVIVKFKDNVVNVGSGFDDSTRKEFWNNKEKLIGRIAEVKYKEITKDKKTQLESLQFPIFVQLREIGKGISYD